MYLVVGLSKGQRKDPQVAYTSIKSPSLTKVSEGMNEEEDAAAEGTKNESEATPPNGSSAGLMSLKFELCPFIELLPLYTSSYLLSSRIYPLMPILSNTVYAQQEAKSSYLARCLPPRNKRMDWDEMRMNTSLDDAGF